MANTDFPSGLTLIQKKPEDHEKLEVWYIDAAGTALIQRNCLMKRDTSNGASTYLVPCDAGDAVYGVARYFAKTSNPGQFMESRPASAQSEDWIVLVRRAHADDEYEVQDSAATDGAAFALDSLGRPSTPANRFCDIVQDAGNDDDQVDGSELDATTATTSGQLEVIALAGIDANGTAHLNDAGAWQKLRVKINEIEA